MVIVGSGSLANTLGPALHKAGYAITEVIARNSASSRQRAQKLASRVGAATSTARSAALQAALLWFCVPDREIRGAAVSIAARKLDNVRFAFHSSGALSSRELDPLRERGIAVASVHPLMTFVAGSRPSLQGVPFALEGDSAAVGHARRMVRALGGAGFAVPIARKAAYHAWATFSSPLFLAFLVTLEDAAVAAGITRASSRRKSLPIIRQTLENYARLGPSKSFSGPIVRGDIDTVAKHLAVLKGNSDVRDVYMALARSALNGLPAKNRQLLKDLLIAQL